MPRPPQTTPRRDVWFIEPRALTVHYEEARDTSGSSSSKHCILLHGWNSPSWYMDGIQDALQALPTAQDWNFWQVEYPTHFRSFAKSAQTIAEALSQQPHEFSRVVLVGFSMGGLVARQMVADGFACDALVTICSPHEGTARWVPPHSPGTWALSRWSPLLRALNGNTIDQAARKRYYFFAVTYRDRLGHHEDDGIVTARSALGTGLGKVALRRKIKLNYGNEVGRRILGSPHARGMSPRVLAPVFDTCAEIFDRL
jgi:pimeloyl-ACP methyl ester carboxylesterase